MKTYRQSARPALRLDAEEASWWLLLGFEEDSQDQHGAKQILQIGYGVDCAGSLDPPASRCVKCDITVSVESISIIVY